MLSARATSKALSVAYDAVALDLIDLSPRIHDERIVRGNDSDDVNALLFERLEVLNIRGEVTCLAPRSESTCINGQLGRLLTRRGQSYASRTWNADDDHLLSLPFLVGIVYLRNSAFGRVIVLNGNPPEES